MCVCERERESGCEEERDGSVCVYECVRERETCDRIDRRGFGRGRSGADIEKKRAGVCV